MERDENRNAKGSPTVCETTILRELSDFHQDVVQRLSRLEVLVGVSKETLEEHAHEDREEFKDIHHLLEPLIINAAVAEKAGVLAGRKSGVATAGLFTIVAEGVRWLLGQ